MKRAPIRVDVQARVLGIDVSHHQGEIDWPAVAADPQGVRFVMVRTGDGISRDKRAVQNLDRARAAGLRVGAYHYLRGERSAQAQVGLALDLIEQGLGCATALDLPLCPDLEGRPDPDGSGPELATGAWQDLDPSLVADTARVLEVTRLFAEGAEAATGRVPWLYTGVSWHWYVAQRRLVPAWAARMPLWLPSYTSRPERGRPLLPVGPKGEAAPWAAPLVWQWTAKGRVAGIGGNVDLNWYLGAELPP